MPAKPIHTNKPTRPTPESAFAGFQELIQNMKNQSASWTHYINVQGQGGNFNILRMLKSAFFMQAMANRQLFLQYSDSVKIKLLDLQKSLENHGAVVLYSSAEDEYVVEQFFVINDNTAVVTKRRSFDQTDIYVLTFDRSFLEETIKKILNFKEKDVQMETS